jgi:hypothetical protein
MELLPLFESWFYWAEKLMVYKQNQRWYFNNTPVAKIQALPRCSSLKFLVPMREQEEKLKEAKAKTD